MLEDTMPDFWHIAVAVLLLITIGQGWVLIYLNYKNRQLAKRGVANTEAARENAAIISRVVGEPGPRVILDPPPSPQEKMRKEKK